MEEILWRLFASIAFCPCLMTFYIVDMTIITIYIMILIGIEYIKYVEIITNYFLVLIILQYI